ncbi:MAG TPA: helix-turn-helix domain-containing protein [Mycobacterium sp.]|nr:helix-turn-helix domain-containing protein [Mycobacterium sp.]
MFSIFRFQGEITVPTSSKTPPAADVDISGAAGELKTSKKFVRRRIADGSLPAYRIKGSRLIRIRRADLEALKQPVGGAV